MSKQRFLPYGRQHITDDDIDAVARVLRSDWLTQGPAVPEFEKSLAIKVGAEDAVACSNGTAALHLAMMALDVKEGDVVVTTPLTFLATANAARFVGAAVRFVDVDPTTGLMDPKALAQLLSNDPDRRIKAVIPVHLAGQPADLPALWKLIDSHGAVIVDDACHAIGSSYDFEGAQIPIGGGPHRAMTCYSFHPVKHIAMGEGGAVTTDNPDLAKRLRMYRNHGMQKDDFVQSEMALSPEGEVNPWYYEMQQLGYNYRLTDSQAALGHSQLKRLDWSVRKRNDLANCYRQLLKETFPAGEVRALAMREQVEHAYHLFVVLIDFDRFGISRARVMDGLKEAGIGTQVHYIPVHLQPYYRKLYGSGPGDFPGAEEYYRYALSLPMYPDLTENDIERIVAELSHILMRA